MISMSPTPTLPSLLKSLGQRGGPRETERATQGRRETGRWERGKIVFVPLCHLGGHGPLFDSPHLRLLTAFLALTWAPGWCCCQLHAGEVQPETVQSADSCCSATAPAVTPGPKQRVCCEATFGRNGPAEEDSCGCLHAPDDAVRPATTIAPPGGRHAAGVDLLAPLPPSLAPLAARSDRPRACRGSPRAAPGQTLFSLRSLLLV